MDCLRTYSMRWHSQVFPLKDVKASYASVSLSA
jgi:hypothetical protein